MARPKKIVEHKDTTGAEVEVVTVSDVETPEEEDAKTAKVEVVSEHVDPADPEEEPVEAEDIKVKIRMREDHQCVIAMERYDFKKVKTYNVPQNVKAVLSRRGLLDPL